MELRCPACRTGIALEDVNPSTDLALCRHCSKTYSFALLNSVATIDLRHQPAGATFETTPEGFTAQATTRSWMGVFFVPFTCVWAGTSVGGIYGRQILRGTFSATDSFFGLPFLIGSIILAGLSLLSVCGVVRVTRRGPELEIFTGVGPVGWRRRCIWREIGKVQAEVVSANRSMGWRQDRVIVLEGTTRVVFGSLLTEERRYFILRVLQKTLVTR